MTDSEEKTLADILARCFKMARRELEDAGIESDLAIISYSKKPESKFVVSRAMCRKNDIDYVIRALKISIEQLEKQRDAKRISDHRKLH